MSKNDLFCCQVSRLYLEVAAMTTYDIPSLDVNPGLMLALIIRII